MVIDDPILMGEAVVVVSSRGGGGVGDDGLKNEVWIWGGDDDFDCADDGGEGWSEMNGACDC